MSHPNSGASLPYPRSAAFITDTNDELRELGWVRRQKLWAEMKGPAIPQSVSRTFRNAFGRRPIPMAADPVSEQEDLIVTLRVVVQDACSPPLGNVRTDARRGFQQGQA